MPTSTRHRRRTQRTNRGFEVITSEPYRGRRLTEAEVTHLLATTPKKKPRGIWRVVPLKREWLRRQHIIDGGGSSHTGTTCIMEAVALATGQKHTDHPVCVSDVITKVLIQANDTRKTDRGRARLKVLAPTILGTAPTKIVVYEARIKYYEIERQYWEVKDSDDPAYRKLERRRHDLLVSLGVSDSDITSSTPVTEIIPAVEAAAQLRP
jgi:hypothetical protein